MMEDGYTLGIHCTEKLRSSTDVDATFMSSILWDGESNLL